MSRANGQGPLQVEAGSPPTQSEPAFYNDLEETLRESWRLLARGVKDRRHAFHTPAIASLRPDGSPTVRTLVLRAVDPENRTLRLHTDVRSAKFQELAADPRIAAHFYDPARKVQLRIGGRAGLHTEDDRGAQAWAGTRPFSRQCYRVASAPGSELADPRQAPIVPDAKDPDLGRENFAAIQVKIDTLEWLYLAARGHRRARFAWPDGKLRATWLVP